MSKVNNMRKKAENMNKKGKNYLYQVTARAVVSFNKKTNPRVDVDADFHYLIAPEVKQYLPFILNEAFKVQNKEVFVIDVGRGNHSKDRQGVLKVIVSEILMENGYKYFSAQDGLFSIYRRTMWQYIIHRFVLIPLRKLW